MAGAARLLALRRWHRRVGLVACGGIILWAVSGALHPLLSRYQPQPAQHTPPALASVPHAARPLADILREQEVPDFRRARLVSWPAGTFYQVLVDTGPPRYFEVSNGQELPNGDRAYAEYLARHYLADRTTPITALGRTDHFGGEYLEVNRLLPVYRVDFARADRLRVYVDTGSSLLATLVDDRKALFTDLFTLLHNWRFAGDGDMPRVPLAAIVVASALLTPLLGTALYLLQRQRTSRPLARAHRTLGLAVGLMLLASATSGGYHLLKGALDRRTGTPAPQRAWDPLPAAAAHMPPPAGAAHTSLTIVGIDGAPWYRAQAATAAVAAAHQHRITTAPIVVPAHYSSAGPAGTAATPDDLGYARALAGRLSGLPPERITSVTAITAFSGEYGFINKLLPVYRVDYATPRHARYYVHLDTATLAAAIDDLDYVEGWTFANLHKWQWLEFIGRWPRDLVMMAFALTSAGVAMLGLRLFLRQPR